jgi:hypothetical protein
MVGNFLIVLFKNKKKRKIIKRYSTEVNVKKKFKKILNENSKITFEKIIENATDSSYEIGIITNTTNVQKSLSLRDNLGRNIPVNLDDSDYVFLDIETYRMEEKIYDCQKKERISFQEFIKNYCDKFKELKSIYTLNNKICVQVDADVFIFSLKNQDESKRFLDCCSSYFYENNRSDAFFVYDVSTAQRKWIYKTLEEKGFNKKTLYRLKTTFSKR